MAWVLARSADAAQRLQTYSSQRRCARVWRIFAAVAAFLLDVHVNVRSGARRSRRESARHFGAAGSPFAFGRAPGKGMSMSLDNLSRSAYSEDHEAFRATVRQFLEKEIAPNAAKWAEDGIVPKTIWPKAGELGMLCPTVPEEYGGLGLDFGYNAIVDEESAYYGRATTGFSLQSDIVTSYIVKYGSEEQKKHWLPKMVAGEVITAIAMTEPGTGSDLQGMRTTAKKDGNHYVINGSKTYITNGQNADLILVCAKTDTEVRSRPGRACRSCSSRPTARASSAAATSTRSGRTRPTRRNCSSRMSACR
jgi:hypothetical protein